MISSPHRFAADIPKVELHVHSDVAILPLSVLHLARRHEEGLTILDTITT